MVERVLQTHTEVRLHPEPVEISQVEQVRVERRLLPVALASTPNTCIWTFFSLTNVAITSGVRFARGVLVSQVRIVRRKLLPHL